MSKASELCVARARQSKGLPLTERQKELLYESKFPKPKKPRTTRVKTEAEIAMDKHKKAKRRAKFAINCNEGNKWFQKWIDWEDKTIPVGRRRVAFVRYLTMTKGYSLDDAKYRAKQYIH